MGNLKWILLGIFLVITGLGLLGVGIGGVLSLVAGICALVAGILFIVNRQTEILCRVRLPTGGCALQKYDPGGEMYHESFPYA